MGRRKGERRIVKEVRPYTADHPVAGSIRRGSYWFDAWVTEMTTSYPVLTKRTNISHERLMEMSHGAEASADEVALLAAAWYVTPEGLMESIRDGQRRRRAHNCEQGALSTG